MFQRLITRLALNWPCWSDFLSPVSISHNYLMNSEERTPKKKKRLAEKYEGTLKWKLRYMHFKLKGVSMSTAKSPNSEVVEKTTTSVSVVRIRPINFNGPSHFRGLDKIWWGFAVSKSLVFKFFTFTRTEVAASPANTESHYNHVYHIQKCKIQQRLVKISSNRFKPYQIDLPVFLSLPTSLNKVSGKHSIMVLQVFA